MTSLTASRDWGNNTTLLDGWIYGYKQQARIKKSEKKFLIIIFFFKSFIFLFFFFSWGYICSFALKPI